MDVERATRAEPRQRGTAKAIPQSGKRGQSVVEFALVLPLLMLLLLLVVDFGRAYMGWVELNNAARVAANYAAQNPSGPFGTAYASLVSTDATGSNCPLPSPIPTPTFPNGTQLGAQAQVTLTCPFHLIVSAFPGFGQLLPNPATLSATAYFPVRTGTIAVAAPTCTGTAPTATIAASPISGSAPLSVTFALGSSGSPTGWTLDYGDGSWESGSGAPPATLTHTYASADQPTFDSSGNVNGNGFMPYVATLTTWNNCGYSAPATTQVTVFGISTWFTIAWQQGTTTCTPSSPCTLTAGTLLNFQGFAYQTGDGQNGSPASPCSWSWVFGGSTGSNNTSTLQNPSYTYATSGTYTPTLSVTCAGSTATSSQTIAVAGCVVPSLVGNSVATADSIWTQAGFQTTPQVVGNTNQGAYTWVTSQNVASGTTDPTCSTNIHLTVGPTPTPTPTP